MTNDPTCNERGIPQSDCPPFCPHDFGTTGPYGFTQPVSDADYRDAFFRVSERCDELQADAAERQWNALEMARRADAAERRAEEAEYHVEQLRDARDRAERRIERVEALADEWAKEGPSLIRNAYSGSDVHEGQTLERCARQLLGVVRADDMGERAHVLAERLASDAALVRLAEAEALRTAARRFVDDMADAWGGNAQWFTTGTRVAEVVACVLREMATDLEADDCTHEWLDRPESDTRECLICGTEVAG